MIASTVIEFRAETSTAPPVINGGITNGWFYKLLGRLDENLAAQLHKSDRHKFALSELYRVEASAEHEEDRSGACYELKVVSLSEPLSTLLNRLDIKSVPPLFSHGFRAAANNIFRDPSERKEAGTVTFEEIWNRHSDSRISTGRAGLEFITGTAFAGSRGNELFPHPKILFEGLSKTWNAVSLLKINDALTSEIRQISRVEEYKLSTVLYRLEDIIAKGFVGFCEYSIPASSSLELKQAFHALLELALYSGVGLRTTMGMGQVRLRKIKPRRT